jgi:hypothetical protein
LLNTAENCDGSANAEAQRLVDAGIEVVANKPEDKKQFPPLLPW